MYRIYPSKQFERSLKKVLHSGKIKEKEISEVIKLLASGNILPPKYKDHALHGAMDRQRECHIRGDVLLIYKIEERQLILILVNIGSHSELF